MSHSTAHLSAVTAGWLLAGTLLGLVHFLSLRCNVRWLLGGRMMMSLGLQLFRFGLTALALTLIARWFGAQPLLACALGLLAGRTGVVLSEQDP